MASTEPSHLIGNIAYAVQQGADSLALQWATYTRTDGELPSWQTYARALAALDQLLGTAREVRAQIETMAAPLMPSEATVVADVGLVSKHGTGRKVEWDVPSLQAELARTLGARLSDDRTVLVDEDGCTLPPSEIALRAVSRAVEATVDCCGMTGSKDWRSGALARFGIDAKEYKASDFAGYRVKITPGVIDMEGPNDAQD